MLVPGWSGVWARVSEGLVACLQPLARHAAGARGSGRELVPQRRIVGPRYGHVVVPERRAPLAVGAAQRLRQPDPDLPVGQRLADVGHGLVLPADAPVVAAHVDALDLEPRRDRQDDVGVGGGLLVEQAREHVEVEGGQCPAHLVGVRGAQDQVAHAHERPDRVRVAGQDGLGDLVRSDRQALRFLRHLAYDGRQAQPARPCVVHKVAPAARRAHVARHRRQRGERAVGLGGVDLVRDAGVAEDGRAVGAGVALGDLADGGRRHVAPRLGPLGAHALLAERVADLVQPDGPVPDERVVDQVLRQHVRQHPQHQRQVRLWTRRDPQVGLGAGRRQARVDDHQRGAGLGPLAQEVGERDRVRLGLVRAEKEGGTPPTPGPRAP